MTDKVMVPGGVTFIARNEVEAPFTDAFYKRDTKYQKKGDKYLSTDLKKWEFDNVIKWFSKDYMLDVMQAHINLKSQAAYENNVDEDSGKFDLEGFIKDTGALSARGESMEDLKERKDYLSEDEFHRIVAEMGKATTLEQKAVLYLEMEKISDELKLIRAAMDDKTRVYAQRAKKRGEKKEAVES